MADFRFEPGMVWLVGAGPGNPDLLTRRAEKLIEAASVIFYDALVGRDILALAPPSTRLVPVGKRSGRHSRSQEAINDLLLGAARAGERVVRLKGGDPSVFGRSGEEIDHLRCHGIEVAICPGITAASAAAASAGITLTMRGEARKLTLLTGHARAGEELEYDWSALADPDTTLAVYMGKKSAPGIARQLLRAGIPGDMPALIVEDASLPSERLLSTRLDLLGVAASSLAGSGAMILIIGSTVGAVRRRAAGLAAADGASELQVTSAA